jgi:hypothetical protein
MFWALALAFCCTARVAEYCSGLWTLLAVCVVWRIAFRQPAPALVRFSNSITRVWHVVWHDRFQYISSLSYHKISYSSWPPFCSSLTYDSVATVYQNRNGTWGLEELGGDGGDKFHGLYSSTDAHLLETVGNSGGFKRWNPVSGECLFETLKSPRLLTHWHSHRIDGWWEEQWRGCGVFFIFGVHEHAVPSRSSIIECNSRLQIRSSVLMKKTQPTCSIRLSEVQIIPNKYACRSCADSLRKTRPRGSCRCYTFR